MKALIAACILAAGTLAVTAPAADAGPAVGIRIGNVGIGVGHYRHHNHYYRHRHFKHGHYRYW